MAERNQNAGKRAAGDEMSDTIQAAKDATRDTLDHVKSQAGAVGQAAQRQAGRLGEQMRDAAESLLDEQKERMADAVHGLADALRHAADTLERDDKAAVARYADQAAEQIDRFSTTMREQHLKDMVASTESFARRQPVLFVAGAVAAGFVVGRLLTRSSESGPSAPAPTAYATTGGESAYHPATRPTVEAMGAYGVGSSAGAEKV